MELEEKDLASAQPEKVTELMKLLKQYIVNGRSTDGKPLNKNELELWPQVAWVKHVQ